MRKFRFIGSQKEKHTSYLINFSVGECYNEDRKAFRDSPLTIQDAALMYPKDWEEVFDETKPFHKDTDLGYFAGIVLPLLFTKAEFYVQKHGTNKLMDKLIDHSIFVAKQLIKQLDAESQQNNIHDQR